MSSSAYCLYARTVQACVLKVLMDAIKDLLVDATLQFCEDGVKLVALDNTHVVMIHLRLDAHRFEEYHCEAPVSIGINLANFQKLLKTVNTTDTLTMFLETSDRNRLGIRVENEDKHTRTEFKLNLLDLDGANFEIPPITFSSVVQLPSTFFQKTVRDMSGLSDKVEMKNVGKQLILTCTGDFCAQETVLQDTDCVDMDVADGADGPDGPEGPDGPDVPDVPDGAITQGIFSLKYLVLFTKCSALCQTVELYLKNNYPLVVRYVLPLGELRLALSPQLDE